MQFLYPIGFIALASLALPILIHLWRVKQGKTLKIGSISLLGESAASNARNLKISEWLLFLLRCLFFILLAILIAKPYLKGKPLTQNKAGWILLDEKNLKPIYLSHKKKIDSLIKKGYQLRHFGKNFRRIELRDTAKATFDNDTIASKLNYTSLLKQANQNLPNRFPIWVFAPKYANQLDDALPTLHLAIHWQSVPPADTSKVKYTQFLGKTYQTAIQGNAITYSQTEQENAAALNVLIYPTNTEDAKYVKAALSAIGSYLNQPIQFYNRVESKELDAIFWLSTTSISSETIDHLKTNGVLLRYANSKSIKNSSKLIIDENASAEFPVVKIRNAITADSKAEMIWKDGFGNPILTEEEQSRHYVYQLYTQLNPQWTDLVWKDNFAQALIPILYHEKSKAFAFQQTQQIDDKQPVAVFEDAKQNKTMYAADQPLDRMIWVLAFMVLLAERLLNFKAKKLKVN